MDLARAYKIEISPEWTRDRLLSTLIPLEQAGQFKGDPVDKQAFRRALTNSDEPPIPEPVDQERPEDFGPPLKAPNSFQAAKQLCKMYGINSFGMTENQMLEAVLNARQGQSAAQGEPDDQGVPEGDGQLGKSRNHPTLEEVRRGAGEAE